MLHRQLSARYPPAPSLSARSCVEWWLPDPSGSGRRVCLCGVKAAILPAYPPKNDKSVPNGRLPLPSCLSPQLQVAQGHSIGSGFQTQASKEFAPAGVALSVTAPMPAATSWRIKALITRGGVAADDLGLTNHTASSASGGGRDQNMKVVQASWVSVPDPKRSSPTSCGCNATT